MIDEVDPKLCFNPTQLCTLKLDQLDQHVCFCSVQERENMQAQREYANPRKFKFACFEATVVSTEPA